MAAEDTPGRPPGKKRRVDCSRRRYNFAEQKIFGGITLCAHTHAWATITRFDTTYIGSNLFMDAFDTLN